MPTHLDSNLLASVENGDCSPDLLLRAVTEHLHELSEDWATTLQRAAREGSLAAALAAERLGVGVLSELRPPLAAAAAKAMSALRSLPGARRSRRALGGRVRAANPLLVDALIDEAREALRQSPTDAHAWLDLAWCCHAVLLGMGLPGDLLVSRTARLLAHRANVLRVAGELHAADAEFGRLRAEGLVARVVDPHVRAELASLEASLRQDQRRFVAAETLLADAEQRYASLGDLKGLGRVRLKRGTTYYLQGKTRAAIEAFRQAATVLVPHSHPREFLMTQHNLALALLDLGEVDEAAVVFEENLLRYESVDDAWSRPLRWWLEGRLAREREHFEVANEALEKVRSTYLEAGFGLDVALVTLDLTDLYLAQGRWTEVRRLATEMETLFAAQEVHREALAALLYFQRAVEGEAATALLVARFRRYLEISWNDPACRFDPSPDSEGR